jgi:DNA-binding NarL/FixJ family response regulator
MLTERQREVLRELETGCSPSEIAKRCHISVRAVQRAIRGLEDDFGVETLYSLAVEVRERELRP